MRTAADLRRERLERLHDDFMDADRRHPGFYHYALYSPDDFWTQALLGRLFENDRWEVPEGFSRAMRSLQANGGNAGSSPASGKFAESRRRLTPNSLPHVSLIHDRLDWLIEHGPRIDVDGWTTEMRETMERKCAYPIALADDVRCILWFYFLFQLRARWHEVIDGDPDENHHWVAFDKVGWLGRFVTRGDGTRAQQLFGHLARMMCAESETTQSTDPWRETPIEKWISSIYRIESVRRRYSHIRPNIHIGRLVTIPIEMLTLTTSVFHASALAIEQMLEERSEGQDEPVGAENGERTADKNKCPRGIVGRILKHKNPAIKPAYLALQERYRRGDRMSPTKIEIILESMGLDDTPRNRRKAETVRSEIQRIERKYGADN